MKNDKLIIDKKDMDSDIFIYNTDTHLNVHINKLIKTSPLGKLILSRDTINDTYDINFTKEEIETLYKMCKIVLGKYRRKHTKKNENLPIKINIPYEGDKDGYKPDTEDKNRTDKI